MKIKYVNRKKHGFTLIEIIVAIGLLTVIGVGSFVGIRSILKNEENKKISKTFKKVDEALEIYLANHSEVIENVTDNVEGAVVTLEVLRNEGLIPDNLVDYRTNDNKPLDYKNNYYVLSDAVLLQNEELGNESACKGQVSLNVIKNWNLTNHNTSEVIYICPKDGVNSDKITELENEIKSLKDRVTALENNSNQNITNIYQLLPDYKNSDRVLENDYYYKGNPTNNYICLKGNDESCRNPYRIMSVNTDDSLTLFSTTDFSLANNFEGKTQYVIASYLKSAQSYSDNYNDLQFVSYGKYLSCSKNGDIAEAYNYLSYSQTKPSAPKYSQTSSGLYGSTPSYTYVMENKRTNLPTKISIYDLYNTIDCSVEFVKEGQSRHTHGRSSTDWNDYQDYVYSVKNYNYLVGSSYKNSSLELSHQHAQFDGTTTYSDPYIMAYITLSGNDYELKKVDNGRKAGKRYTYTFDSGDELCHGSLCKVTLKQCMVIDGGGGTISKPYELVDRCN